MFHEECGNRWVAAHTNCVSHVECMRFCVVVGREEEKNRCRIVGLGRELENDVCTGRDLETVLESRTHYVLEAQGRVPVNRSRYALAELEKVHESHSHVFEGQVCLQYYRELRPWGLVKVPETTRDCPASVVLHV